VRASVACNACLATLQASTGRKTPEAELRHGLHLAAAGAPLGLTGVHTRLDGVACALADAKLIEQCREGPSKVPRGLSPVTVRTANIALADLRQHHGPRFARGQPCHISALLWPVAMTELQDKWIAGSAVDARTRAQMHEAQPTVLGAIPGHPRYLASDVGIAVPKVVLTPIRGVAAATVTLPLPGRDRTEREVRFGLPLMTHAAETHGAPSSSERLCLAPTLV
jgi:hypothetical protein